MHRQIPLPRGWNRRVWSSIVHILALVRDEADRTGSELPGQPPASTNRLASTRRIVRSTSPSTTDWVLSASAVMSTPVTPPHGSEVPLFK